MRKVLWVKFGWSDYYSGEPVEGDFSWLQEGNIGHEELNFKQSLDGIYHCYVPPQGGEFSPYDRHNYDQEGWTVICLAKHPGHTGKHIVGWYEDATLLGEWKINPDSDKECTYCITSQKAYLVPPEHREDTLIKHRSLTGQCIYSFLAKPGRKWFKNEQEKEKKDVLLELLQRRMEKVRSVVVKNP